MIWALLLLAAGAAWWIRRRAQRAPRPPGLGATEGSLAPCPDTPNCVSTTSALPGRQLVAPALAVSVERAQAAVEETVGKMRGARLTASTPGYVAAEFHLPVLGFIDDVEFLLAPGEPLHFRSASRSGTGDLGVNRRRMLKILEELRRRGVIDPAS